MSTKREELRAQIENLERIINSGASSITEDGQSTTFDLAMSRKRLQELRDELNIVEGKRPRRPLFGTIDMSNY